MPPKWLHEPENVEAVEGQDILLPCQVEGFPKPVVVWTRDASGFTKSGDQEVLTLSESQFVNGSLLIADASKGNEGRYTCTADNGVRDAKVHKTVNVTVNGERNLCVF